MKSTYKEFHPDTYAAAYSFERPAHIVANALLNGMIAGGLTEAEAVCLIHSKAYRWTLDFSMENALETLGEHYGREMAAEYQGHEWTCYPLPCNPALISEGVNP
jgi:uncharacterized protein YdaT